MGPLEAVLALRVAGSGCCLVTYGKSGRIGRDIRIGRGWRRADSHFIYPGEDTLIPYCL